MGVRGKRVLVVDDDPRILDGVARMLEEEGCVAYTTDEPSKVVETARTMRPDVILLDVRMPEISGYDVFERLQKEPSTSWIPVVLMTARAITLRMPASLLRDLAGFINKPFSRLQLIQGLRSAIKKHGEGSASKISGSQG